jgi:hypothetical protein
MATQPPALMSTSPIAAHMLATIANTPPTAIAATSTAIQLDLAPTFPSPAPSGRRPANDAAYLAHPVMAQCIAPARPGTEI